jgi:DNA-binding MarR family transcriptional regulator
MTMSTADPPAAAMPARGTGPEAGSAAPTAAIEALEQQLSRLFATAKTLVRDRAVAVHPELSPGSYTVLAALVRSGPKHGRSLAAPLYMDKSVISRIVRQLTDLGLAERRPDPGDGRAFYIAATPVAVRQVDAIRDDYRRSLYRFLGAGTPPTSPSSRSSSPA